ncbi:DUF2177 family protein [Paraglaciecola sp. MB-3u-78]|jgi:uncharacterized membrane protein|uniref:DUF2177 family protein n=1 Tax=Paraglaciecola sp. MB-3u-78 TaxID=2058332 RepID=UPI001E50D8C1|nr:DUF2177 family protein [Paraglaciecola sp. MB-3u-78]
MKANILTYLTLLLSLLILDGIWLGLVAKDGYQQAMGHIMREQVIIWPWIVFYLLYPLAILILAIKVQLSTQSRFYFLWRGFVLGAAAYGTYNLTNYALVVNWPLSITIKDWLWGAILTSICAMLGGHVWLKYPLQSKTK